MQENSYHLSFFANDPMVFIDGQLYSIRALYSNMDIFYRQPGHRLNAKKIELFCSGMIESHIHELETALGFK